METEVGELIFERFYAELAECGAWGPAAVDALQTLQARGQLQRDPLILDMYRRLAENPG